MKLPEVIKGVNRIRDFKICVDYINGHSSKEIKENRNLKITVRRIDQILYEHSDFLNPRIAWPKSKRIHKRQRLIENADQKSRKDIVDQLNDLRTEIEGDKASVNIEKHTHYTTVVQQIRQVLENKEEPVNRLNAGTVEQRTH